MIVMVQPGCFRASARTMADPTKPVPPETSTFFEATILVSMVSRVVVERWRVMQGSVQATCSREENCT